MRTAIQAACLAGLGVLPSLPASAGNGFTVIHGFTGGADGGTPQSALIADPSGNLYGTTFVGGVSGSCTGCGTVFELTPTVNKKTGKTSWKEVVIYDFQGFADGANPAAGLSIDPAGNLYGTTLYGGNYTGACATDGCGTVFMLAPPTGDQNTWTKSTLYSFSGGTDGGLPFTTLALDSFGNLFGSSFYFGDTNLAACMPVSEPPQPNGCGLVFELSPPGGGVTPWTESVVHTFTNSPDGAYPSAGPVIDGKGNLYGVTAYGGTGAGLGTVFMLSLVSGIWTETILYSFSGADGDFPYDSLTLDAGGGLYGTTRAGGNACAGVDDGCGVVFSLMPPGSGIPPWKEQAIWKFRGGKDGAYPVAGVALDTAGNLFGTTDFGGGGPCMVDPGVLPDGCGTIFELIPPLGGGSKWTETILHRYKNGKDGAYPEAGVLITGVGAPTTMQTNLFGTASSGGTGGGGTASTDSVHRGLAR
jgi:hypothetical protein